MVPKFKTKWLKAPLSLNRKTTQCENHGHSVYSQWESKSCLCEWARWPGLRFPALPERVELMSMFALSCDCLPCVSQKSAMSKKKHQSSTQNVLVFLFLCVCSSKKQTDSCARVCVCVRAKCTLLEEQESELVQLQRCTKHRGGAGRKGGVALALSPLCRTVAHHNSNGSLNTRTSACHVTRWLLLISSRPHKRKGGETGLDAYVWWCWEHKQTNKQTQQTNNNSNKHQELSLLVECGDV